MMKPLFRGGACLALLLALLSLVMITTPAFAQHRGPVFGRSDHAVTHPLREIAPLKEKEGHREKPIHLLTRTAAGVPDGALQTLATTAPSFGNIFSFDGLGVGGGYTPNAAPPDTNGAVGLTQYVQWVNESFAVYNKTTGALVYGPAAGNTLYQALGSTHPCAAHNDGDPIAQYDKINNRWILTQFSVTNGSSQGYWQCVAVSQTSDATGAYNVYAFNYGTTDFNDYPKLGVWGNNYYVTFNIFANGNTFSGSKLCAYDGAAMRAGTAANQVCFQLSSSFGGVLPADVDGTTAPPAGSGEYFLAFGTNVLQLWTMSNVNFTAGTATLSGPVNLPVASFSAACSGGGTCIPQLGTTQQLDSLADRLMYRLAYRNFGDHEALVVNHSVTAGSSVGVRWYEIRSPGSNPTVYQQGTFAPDSSYRWMGSAAMDHAGNLAIGYSVSSSSINPGIRFTGRAATDPLGTLGLEQTIKDGTGSQLRTLNRWGDYSSISVDPVDDCTMWYTTEYLQTNGTFNWSTRIANFKFNNCGGSTTPDFTISASPASQTVTQGNGTSYTVNVGAVNGYTGTVNLSVSGLPAGASASFNPASVAGSGSSTMSVSTSASTPTGTYTLTVNGSDGTLSHSTTVSLVVNAPAPPDFSISASPATQTVVQGNGTSYTTNVSALNGFSGTVNFSVSGLPAGASASFNPTSVIGSGSSTMSVSTSASTPAGSYTLTITGMSGTLSHSATVTLVVNSANPPDFTIAASPASLAVTRGTSGNYTVTVTGVNGFSGTVSLSVSGLPGRTSASFNPASVTGSGTSTLTITVNRKASRGSFPLTITGTSGSLSHSANVTLVIQ